MKITIIINAQINNINNGLLKLIKISFKKLIILIIKIIYNKLIVLILTIA